MIVEQVFAWPGMGRLMLQSVSIMAQLSTFTASSPVAEPRRSRLHRGFARLWRSPVGLIGVLIVSAVVVAALFAPQLALHSPSKLQLGSRFMPPAWLDGGSWGYLLGTDQLGRDVLSRILYGARISVLVGVGASLISGAIGVLIGLVAGFYGGLADSILSRIVDTFLAISFIVLALAVMTVLKPGLATLIIVLGVTGWVTYARVVRGEVLSVKERDYVLGAGLSVRGLSPLLRTTWCPTCSPR